MLTFPRRWRSLIGMLAVFSLFIVACGDDDDTSAGDATEDADAGGDMADDMDGGDMDGDAVAVTAVDYGYDGLPATVAAGTSFSLTNTSEIELHELVAIKLADDETRPAAELIQLPPEELGALVGPTGPATVVIAQPGGGEGMAVVGDGSLAEPGRYLIACFIPIGVEPEVYMAAAEAAPPGEPPQVEGAGPPHFTQGMFAELVVE